MTTATRTWTLPHPEPEPRLGPPDLSQRGACLTVIEFLVRYPCSECIVTSCAFPFMDTVLDMFPKTLFHVFCAQLEVPPKPNVIRHQAVFSKEMASAWRERGGGGPFNVIFTGEGMDSQMALYASASPSAALLLVTAPPEYYLAGDLMAPLYGTHESCACMMVPRGGCRAEPYGFEAYLRGLRRFHTAHRGVDSTYDRDVETSIVTAYAQTVVCDEITARLLAEVIRAGLPQVHDAPMRFSVEAHDPCNGALWATNALKF